MSCALGPVERHVATYGVIIMSMPVRGKSSSSIPASIPESTSKPQILFCVHMPGSDDDGSDNDGDHASGLLQNILERVSDGEPW